MVVLNRDLSPRVGQARGSRSRLAMNPSDRPRAGLCWAAVVFLVGFLFPQVAWPQAGSADTGFNADLLIRYPVRAVAIQPDGRILVGGEFRRGDGSAENYVARLNQNASPDPSFNPGEGPDGTVRGIVLQPDGSILVGGSFSRVNGLQSDSVARLDPTGAVDTNFVCGLFSGAKLLALQADG